MGEMRDIYTYVKSKDGQNIVVDYNIKGVELRDNITIGNKAKYRVYGTFDNGYLRAELVEVFCDEEYSFTNKDNGDYIVLIKDNKDVDGSIMKPKEIANIIFNDMEGLREHYVPIPKEEQVACDTEWYTYTTYHGKDYRMLPDGMGTHDDYVKMFSKYPELHNEYRVTIITMDDCILEEVRLDKAIISMHKHMHACNDFSLEAWLCLDAAKLDRYLMDSGQTPLFKK